MVKTTITVSIMTRIEPMYDEVHKIANVMTVEIEKRFRNMERVGPAVRSFKIGEG